MVPLARRITRLSPLGTGASRFAIAVLMLFAIVYTTGCVDDEEDGGDVPTATATTNEPASKPQPSGTAAPPAPVQETRFQPDPEAWDALVESAQTEGVVVVDGPPTPGFREKLAKAFEDEYGITLEYRSAPAGTLPTLLQQEAAAGARTVDAVITGSVFCWEAGQRGLVVPPEDLIVNPELFSEGLWTYGSLKPILPSPSMPQDQYCGIQVAESINSDLFINPTVIDPAEIQSWRDLLKPEYRGKIAAWDPRVGGPSGTTIGYLNTVFGEQFLLDLFVGQEIVFSTDSRQLSEWLVRGTYPIVMNASAAFLEPFREQGLKYLRHFPEDGPGIRTGGFGVIFVVDQAPHSAAAQLFLNWMAGPTAGQIYQEEMFTVSLRTDVPKDGLLDWIQPNPNVEYPYDDYDPQYFYDNRVPGVNAIVEALAQ